MWIIGILISITCIAVFIAAMCIAILTLDKTPEPIHRSTWERYVDTEDVQTINLAPIVLREKLAARRRQSRKDY